MYNFNITVKYSSITYYTRPTYVLKKAYKENPKIFKRDFENLKK